MRIAGRKLAKQWYVSELTLEEYFCDPKPLEGLEEEEPGESGS